MDNIFVISLTRSKTRRQAIMDEFNAKKVRFIFFDAIDGKAGLPALATDYDYTKRLWLTSGKMPTDGEIGCYASHYMLWLKCIMLNQPIIVFEDDVRLADNANEIIRFALEKVLHYGFLRLEPAEINLADKLLSAYLHQVEQDERGQISLMCDNANGARAYALSPLAAAKLIKHRWCFPVDCFIGAAYLHRQPSYLLAPYLVAEHNMYPSTITEQVANTPLYRKLTRELYSGYKKVMLKRKFQQQCNTVLD